jgi:hypothetical protein
MVLGLLKKLLGGGGQKAPLIMGSFVANEAVREQLALHGDDGTAERHVTHYAYPKKDENSASRYEVFEYLAEFDLSLSEAEVGGGIVAEQEREVGSEEFDEFTSRLFDELDAMGWDYDGWECAVVKG